MSDMAVFCSVLYVYLSNKCPNIRLNWPFFWFLRFLTAIIIIIKKEHLNEIIVIGRIINVK